MALSIDKIAVIGTGVIGIGWIIRILAHNKKVVAFDLNQDQKKMHSWIYRDDIGVPHGIHDYEEQ